MKKILLFTHGTALIWPWLFLALPGGWGVLASTILSLMHFAATLVLFYSQPALRKKHAFIGLFLPIFLFVSLLVWMQFYPQSLARALLVFFIFVLWHYCKQSYGFFVLSFREFGGFQRHDSFERQALLLFFLWAALFGFMSGQMMPSSQLAFGFYVQSLALSAEPWVTIGRAGLLLGLAYCLFLCLRYRRYTPFLTALAFALWCDLRLLDYRLLLLLPAFHAIQYLPVAVWRLRSKDASSEKYLSWVVLAIAAVMFTLFHATPKPWPWLLPVLAASEISLNLQHYFLDAYLWRARESAIREALEI